MFLSRRGHSKTTRRSKWKKSGELAVEVTGDGLFCLCCWNILGWSYFHPRDVLHLIQHVLHPISEDTCLDPGYTIVKTCYGFRVASTVQTLSGLGFSYMRVYRRGRSFSFREYFQRVVLHACVDVSLRPGFFFQYFSWPNSVLARQKMITESLSAVNSHTAFPRDDGGDMLLPLEGDMLLPLGGDMLLPLRVICFFLQKVMCFCPQGAICFFL